MEWRDGFDPESVEVKVAELLVATADASDHLIDSSVSDVLKLLRDRMKMDVVFVSEFTGGRRVFRHVEQAPGTSLIVPGGSDLLEDSWCQRVVDGRLPELIPDATSLQATRQVPLTPYPIGTFLSTPVVLPSGEVYGTLCCFSFGVNPHITGDDLKKLRYTAQLTGDKISRARQQAESWKLEPRA